MKILVQWHEAFRWVLVLAMTGYAIWAWNAEAADNTVLQPAMTGDFESLRSLLETRGWRVEHTPDGSTLLFPLRNTQQTAEAKDDSGPQPSMSSDFENLRSLLETRGWRVERTPDGSTLLFPLRNTPLAQSDATQVQEPAPTSITLTVPYEDMQQLRNLLDDYSWKLVQEGGNTLHLLAPAHPHAPSTTTKADCVEEQGKSRFTAGVKLPVNTDEEAWLIVANWLWAYEYKELEVGDIHDMHWIYHVNIIDQRPPHRTVNELIINKQSGQLLRLY